MEKFLREYRFNNARIAFLENRIQRNEIGVDPEIEEELEFLRYMTGVIDDALGIIRYMDEKYVLILKSYFIDHLSMEDIADSIHMSRSRCYELCREAVGCLDRVVYGDRALPQTELWSRDVH